MDIKSYKEYLLSVIPSAVPASGGKFINCRCFYCPDSIDPRSKHFYIAIPQNKDEPSWYYCHKCHCTGIVTHRKLIDWGIYTEEAGSFLYNHNINCSHKKGNRKYYNRDVYNIYNPMTKDSDISQFKLNYISKRLGYNFTYGELRDLKIVLNLKEFLNWNHVYKYTRYDNIVDQLDINFLGFISIDNAFLNMRRLCDEGLVYKSIDSRYINYKIFDKFDTSERFYTIPTEVNLNTRDRIKLHIAEGPFDILSVYVNLRNKEPGIYTSIAGSNYMGIISYFLLTFKLPYIELHVYPDNDKYGTNNMMEKIYNRIKDLGIPMYIHRNMYPGQKDFGVSPNEIKESVIKWGGL